MKEVIVSVGMGPAQYKFISYLKEMGFTVVAFGIGANSPEAVAMVDYSAEIDTLDAKGAIKWIDSLGVKVIAVGSYAGGRAIYTVQLLSQYYQTPTVLPKKLIAPNDKELQQQLYWEYGLSSIKTWDAVDLNTRLLDDEKAEQFIIKPTAGRGSEGIFFATKEKIKKWVVEHNFSRGEYVVQDVREGTEYRCVLFVQDGEIKLLAPIERKSYRDTVFLGTLRYNEKDYSRLFDLFSVFIRESEIVSTVLKADILVSEETIDVIEMDIGVGGGEYYQDYVSSVYGRDLLRDYINLIVGNKIEKYNVYNPGMISANIYNHADYAIEFNEDKSRKSLESLIGTYEIKYNRLRPKDKGGYASNKDFIISVIYDGLKSKISEEELDQYINENFFEIKNS